MYFATFVLASHQSDIPAHVRTLSLLLAATLLAVSIIDQRTRRIPDALNVCIAIFGLAAAWWFGIDGFGTRVFAALAGCCGLGAVIFAYRHIRGREGMGWGDAKFFGAAGTWVGLAGLPTVLLWACLTALALTVVLHFTAGPVTRDTRIPFGPHLAFGTWLVWLFGPLI